MRTAYSSVTAASRTRALRWISRHYLPIPTARAYTATRHLPVLVLPVFYTAWTVAHTLLLWFWFAYRTALPRLLVASGLPVLLAYAYFTLL